jgi:hypothetical protein
MSLSGAASRGAPTDAKQRRIDAAAVRSYCLDEVSHYRAGITQVRHVTNDHQVVPCASGGNREQAPAFRAERRGTEKTATVRIRGIDQVEYDYARFSPLASMNRPYLR